MIDLLKSYFAIEDRDGPRAVREKLTGKLLTLDRALEASLPPLLSLLDVPVDDVQWPTLDPPQRRRRTLDAVKRLLLRESQGQPLLVVFEDLHWIDGETAEAYLLAGRLDDALACGARALRLARERGERGFEAWSLRLLGEIASHHNRPDVATAEAHYGAAMALASELGMRPLVAHCHLGLRKLSRRTDDGVKAREHLSIAATMYREMDISFWLEKAEAELGAVQA